MITGLQLALTAGGLVGLGVALLVWRLAPAEPDLADAIRRLSADHPTRPAAPAGPAVRGRERLGSWVLRAVPALALTRPRTEDLAILRITLARFYGEKVLFALIGLCLPALLTAILSLGGLRPPLVVPVIASLALAGALFFVPDVNVRDDAKKARREFGRALGAYIDLVALETGLGFGDPAGDGGRRHGGRQLGVPPARRGTGAEPVERGRAVGGAAHPRRPARRRRNSTTWPTFSDCPVRRARRCMSSCGPARPACGPLCCITNSPARTRSTSGCRSR